VAGTATPDDASCIARSHRRGSYTTRVTRKEPLMGRSMIRTAATVLALGIGSAVAADGRDPEPAARSQRSDGCRLRTALTARRCVLPLALVIALLPAGAHAVPFWGDKESQSLDVAPAQLKPGQFVWSPRNAPVGPIVVVVSLTEQTAYAYRNGVLIGYAK